MKGCTTNTTFYPLVSNCTYILCLVIALHLITICTVRAQEIGPSKQNEVNLNDRFGSNTTDMVNLATGQVEFSVPLYSISKGSAAFSLNLYYSSTAVANDLRNNKNYNSGVIGVDWQLTESYFFREHNNTINLFDDKFYLSHNGQIIELLIIDHDENNKTISFNTELARPEKITYFYSVSDERWEILSTTGIISIFGGLLKQLLPIEIEYASPSLCTDNAAMIASLAYFQAQHSKPVDPYSLEIEPSLRMAKNTS